VNAGDIDAIVERHAGREGPLLPILHEVQAAQGWISEADIVVIAKALNLSRAEVSGVVSFYHDFRRSLPVLPTLKLCRAEACQARGSEPLARWAAAQAEGKAAVETVYCLGLCSVGPAAMLGGEVYARLDQAAMAALLDRAAR
jgi:formate dehydrogenase subunit gamma